LGFNEIQYLFSTVWYNPIMCLFFAMIIGGVYILYATGMLNVLKPLAGPAFDLVRNNALGAMNNALQRMQSQPQQPRPKVD
jgi:uncharacterized membrane protein